MRRQRSACDDLLAGADEHVGELDGLLHRRLHAVELEQRGGLLGVVDDVVERRGQRVAVARVERRTHATAPASRWMMSWVMRSPSCSQTFRSSARVGVLG